MDSRPPPPLPTGWIRRPGGDDFSDKPYFSKGQLRVKMLVQEVDGFPRYFSYVANGGRGIFLGVPPLNDETGRKVVVLPVNGRLPADLEKLCNLPPPALPPNYSQWLSTLTPDDVEVAPAVVTVPTKKSTVSTVTVPRTIPTAKTTTTTTTAIPSPSSTAVSIPKVSVTLNKTVTNPKPIVANTSVQPSSPSLRTVTKETTVTETLPVFPDRVRMTKSEPKLTLMAPDWSEKVRDGDYVRFIQRDTKQIVSDIWLEELDEDNEYGEPYYTTYWSFAKRLRSTRRPESNDRIILLAYTEGNDERQYPDEELTVTYDILQKLIKAQTNPTVTASSSSSSSVSTTAGITTGTVSAARARLNAVMQTALATNAFSRAVRNTNGAPPRKKAVFTMPEGWTRTTTEDGDTCFVDNEGNALWILWHQVTDGDGRTVWFDCESQNVYYERPNIADDDGAAAIVYSNGERLSTAANVATEETIAAADFDLADALAKVGTALFAQGDQLREVFVAIDSDGNGLLDIDEFTNALENLAMQFTKEQCIAIFNLIDDNASGSINYREFLTAFKDAADAAAQAMAAAEQDENNNADGEDDNALPDGWQAVTDDDGDTYYYNAGTGEAVWERPTG